MNVPRIDVNLGSGVAPQSAVTGIVEAAVRATLAHEGVTDASISVTLSGDTDISRLNQQFLQHEGPTDVLSFPLFDPGEAPVGDIYIGYDQARRQASDLAVAFETELARLAIHGTLHVLGYDHPVDDARELSPMWLRQEEILQAVLQRATAS